MYVAITAGPDTLKHTIPYLPVFHRVGPEFFPNPDAVMGIVPLTGEFTGLGGDYGNHQLNHWKYDAGEDSGLDFHK